MDCLVSEAGPAGTSRSARWPRLQLPSSADAVTIWCVSYLLVGSCELVQTFDICELECHATRLSHEDRNDRGWLRRSRSGHCRHQAQARRHGFEYARPGNALQPSQNTWLQGRLAGGRGAVRGHRPATYLNRRSSRSSTPYEPRKLKATRGPRVTQTDEHFQLPATTLKRKSSLRICSISLALMSWTRGRWSKGNVSRRTRPGIACGSIEKSS